MTPDFVTNNEKIVGGQRVGNCNIGTKDREIRSINSSFTLGTSSRIIYLTGKIVISGKIDTHTTLKGELVVEDVHLVEPSFGKSDQSYRDYTILAAVW